MTSAPNTLREMAEYTASLERRIFELERRRLPEPDHWWFSTGRILFTGPGQTSQVVNFGVQYPQRPVPFRGDEKPVSAGTLTTYPQSTWTINSWTMSGPYYVGATIIAVYGGQAGKPHYVHWTVGGFV